MRMVSFSQYWKNGKREAGALPRALSWNVWWAGLVLLLCFNLARAEGVAADASPLVIERSEDGLFLSTSVKFELPGVVDDVLRKGIPVFFVADADLLRDRWYWSDKKVAAVTRHMRLSYQPLTRRWRLQVAASPIGNNGLGVTLSQNFESVTDALAAVQRFARWRIAEAADVDAEGSYNVDFRFRLDVAQLPRPFQIGVAGQTEWSISVHRNQKLGADLFRTELSRADALKPESAKPEGQAK